MFKQPKGKEIAFKKMVEHIKELLKTSKSKEVIVGCDAQCKSRKTVFVMAVAVPHAFKNKDGGVFYVQKFVIDDKPYRYNLAEKLYKEAQIILDVANKLVDNDIPKEVIVPHVDIGYSGESKKHIKGIVGWLKGSGYSEVVIKPDSWASNCICNKYSKDFKRIK